MSNNSPKLLLSIHTREIGRYVSTGKLASSCSSSVVQWFHCVIFDYLVAERISIAATPYSPVYTRLPSDLDLHPTASGLPGSGLHLPPSQFVAHMPPSAGVYPPSVVQRMQQQPGISAAAAVGRQSPDHIPRSFERHPPTSSSHQLPVRSPYWPDAVKNTRLSSSGVAEAVHSRKAPPVTTIPAGDGGGHISAVAPRSNKSPSLPAGEQSPENELDLFRGVDGVRRDQSTNTDFASEGWIILFP